SGVASADYADGTNKDSSIRAIRAIRGSKSLVPERRPGAGQGRNLAGAKQGGDFFADNLFATDDLLLALLQVVVGDRLQVVDVVEIDVRHQVHLGIDVAGHRD